MVAVCPALRLFFGLHQGSLRHLPMEVADGEGTQSEILRFAQNDRACIFLRLYSRICW